MYHAAAMVRDAKLDMEERIESGRHSTWATYTPFPFLYALSGQITQTMQRKAPDLVKRAAVLTRDHIADAMTTSQQHVHSWCLSATKHGQHVFYSIKNSVETIELPTALVPVQTHVAIPLLNGIEGMVQFITSEELPELYFVAKTSMNQHVVLRSLVLPPLVAIESSIRYLVILPSQLVFPSREEIELRTDVFLQFSTTHVQSFVESLYSATEVLDQHWSMVQWNILGRGPYESLSRERQEEVIRSIHQRMHRIESKFQLYEFMASLRIQNDQLYRDVVDGGIPLPFIEMETNSDLSQALEEQNKCTFPCWFYRKLENTGEMETQPSSGSTGMKTQWMEFPQHENRRLERHYQCFLQDSSHSIVIVDEGRHEVNLKTMEMLPVYWTAIETIQVRRSLWLYAQRNYGLAPYNPSAAIVLEQAFTYYLAHVEEEKQRVQSIPSSSGPIPSVSLSIPVNGDLVEFKGPHDIMQYKRLLAGTTPFMSKRRVYRGDPRIRSDPKLLEIWKQIHENPLESHEDDADLNQPINHLVLIVHGIGDALKTVDLINVVTLRSIIDCATSLRNLHKEALRSNHFDQSVTTQTEFLPIEWHSKLHLNGLDQAIEQVTLPAIPKLRAFANDTILDVLFFMSPYFHQVILEQVGMEMNRVYQLFQSRQGKGWNGKVSIIAHSLGAIIAFDLLQQQEIQREIHLQRSRSDSECLHCTKKKKKKRSKSCIPQLVFSIDNLFCFGSPIGLFLNVRGHSFLNQQYTLPTCKRVFNIYHPYDPVAYRLEPMVNPHRIHSKVAIIRTFEGKLRFHYQVRNLFRQMWSQWRTWRRQFEEEIEQSVYRIGLVETGSTVCTIDTPRQVEEEEEEKEMDDFIYGRLCQGLPIDYSLQENEIEITNEYLFALTAHVIYWGNRDVSLFMAQKMILEPPQM